MNKSIRIEKLMNDYSNVNENSFLIPNLLLSNTSVIISAREKVGKTSLIIQAVKSIVQNDSFLDIKKGNYYVDAIVFYSNDSTPQSIAIKLNKMNFKNSPEVPIYFLFDKSMLISELFEELEQLNLVQKRTLLIIDVLGGLRTNGDFKLNDYMSVSMMLDEIENMMAKVTKCYGIIYLHHLNKGNREMMGSQALGARVSATIKMKLDEYDSTRGIIEIVSNDYESRNIPIKKNMKNHSWVVDKNGYIDTDKEEEMQILKINEFLSKISTKRFRGTVNEVCSFCKLAVQPRGLTRWLKAHKKLLRDNNIVFDIKKSNTTMIDLYLDE